MAKTQKKSLEEFQKDTLNKFLTDHSGILTVLGIFLIFLIQENNFIKLLGVELTAVSNIIAFSGVMIVLICLVLIIRDCFNSKNKGVWFFGIVLIPMFLASALYSLFSLALSETFYGLIKLAPGSFKIAFIVMGSMFFIVLFNERKKIPNCIKIIVNILLFLGATNTLIFYGKSLVNLSHRLLKLDSYIWGSFSIIISYIFYYFMRSRSPK